MKRIKAAAMMACTVTALALTACSGQETAEDPAPSVQDDSSADQVQGDAAGTDSAADAAGGDASAGTSGNGILIVPFCTSASDSIDNILHVFSELAPDAVIAEGLTVNNEEDIAPWLDSLGY
jgi:hypothetical protein